MSKTIPRISKTTTICFAPNNILLLRTLLEHLLSPGHSNIANILLVLGVSSFFFKIELSNIRYKDNIYLFIVTAYFSSLFYFVDEINIYHTLGFILLVILFLNQLRNYDEAQRDAGINKFSNLTYLKLIMSFVGILLEEKYF